MSKITYYRTELYKLPVNTLFKTHPLDKRLFIRGQFDHRAQLFECWRYGQLTKTRLTDGKTFVFVRK